MQKLTKALKKLAGLGEKSPAKSGAKPSTKPVVKSRVAAQLAKKAAPVKKKTQAVVAPKKAAAPVKKALVAAPKKAAAPVGKKTAAPVAKAKTPAAVPKIDVRKKTPVAPAEKLSVKAAVAAKPVTPAGKTVTKAGDGAAPKTAAPVKTRPAPEAAVAVEKKVKAKREAPATINQAPSVEAAATPAPDEEVILTDADGRRYCRVKDCDQAAAVGGGYCRFHYLLFWKNIQNRKKILSEGKLERYVEELTARYPDKYLELLRKDLRSEKDFTAAIQELEIDESAVDNEMEDEAQNYLDEVRGMSSESQPEREEDF